MWSLVKQTRPALTPAVALARSMFRKEQILPQRDSWFRVIFRMVMPIAILVFGSFKTTDGESGTNHAVVLHGQALLVSFLTSGR
jgi:hypothetical protein